MSILLNTLRPVSLAAALVAFALPATTVAQETDAPREPGEPYVADVFTDWELRCITAAEEGQADVSTSTALSPPKAKAFDRTASTCASRASFGTTSSAHSGRVPRSRWSARSPRPSAP
jgi:hypothetical protein